MEVRFRFSPTHQSEGVRNMLMFMLWFQVIEVQLILGQLHLLPPHLLGKYLERTLHLLVICATLRHQLFLASCYLPQKRLSGGSCYTLNQQLCCFQIFQQKQHFCCFWVELLQAVEEEYISHISRERLNGGLIRELHFSYQSRMTEQGFKSRITFLILVEND